MPSISNTLDETPQVCQSSKLDAVIVKAVAGSFVSPNHLFEVLHVQSCQSQSPVYPGKRKATDLADAQGDLLSYHLIVYIDQRRLISCLKFVIQVNGTWKSSDRKDVCDRVSAMLTRKRVRCEQLRVKNLK